MASLLVRGDRHYLPRSLPREYIVASYLNEMVPYSTAEGLVTLTNNVGSDGLIASCAGTANAGSCTMSSVDIETGSIVVGSASAADGSASGPIYNCNGEVCVMSNPTANASVSSSSSNYNQALTNFDGSPIAPTAPVVAVATGWLQAAAQLNTPLSPEFLDHISACILSVGKIASANARKRNMYRERAMHGNSSVGSSSLTATSAGDVATATTSAMHSMANGLTINTNSSSSNSDNSNNTTAAASKHQYPVTPHMSSVRLRGSHGAGSDDDVTITISTSSSSTSTSGSVTTPRDTVNNNNNSNSSSPSRTWKDTHPRSPITEDEEATAADDDCFDYATVTLLEKVWMVLARFDGGTGQCLGPASQNGADSVIGWLCSFILYHPCSISTDLQMPSTVTSCSTVLKELSAIMSTSEFRDQKPAVQHLVSYITEGLKVLKARQDDFAPVNTTAGATAGATGAGDASMQHIPSAVSSSSRGLYRGGVIKKYKYNLCRPENLDDIYDKLARYISHTLASALRSLPFGLGVYLIPYGYFQNGEKNSNNSGDSSSDCSSDSDISDVDYGAQLRGKHRISNSSDSVDTEDEDENEHAVDDDHHYHHPSITTTTTPTSASSLSSDPKGGYFPANPRVGWVIPIHCGHNGWVTDHNISEVKRLIRDYAGFPIEY